MTGGWEDETGEEVLNEEIEDKMHSKSGRVQWSDRGKWSLGHLIVVGCGCRVGWDVATHHLSLGCYGEPQDYSYVINSFWQFKANVLSHAFEIIPDLAHGRTRNEHPLLASHHI